MFSDIPLKILVCDANDATANALVYQLKNHPSVVSVERAPDISAAKSLLHERDINTIFIDPLSYGLDKASDFIFSVRETLPEIVFTLYMEVAAAEAQRSVFYQGERQRFSHYYKLDKSVPIQSFADEVDSVIRTCQADLSFRLSRESLKRLAKETKTASTAEASSVKLSERVEELVDRVLISRALSGFSCHPEDVFSCRGGWAGGLRRGRRSG